MQIGKEAGLKPYHAPLRNVFGDALLAVATEHPRVVVLANLFRDQLDRYGELERLADEWADVVASLEAVGAEIVLNADGTIRYTPNANFNGADSFTYRACDPSGLCATATVNASSDCAPCSLSRWISK